jgi:hypothetical protein
MWLEMMKKMDFLNPVPWPESVRDRPGNVRRSTRHTGTLRAHQIWPRTEGPVVASSQRIYDKKQK